MRLRLLSGLALLALVAAVQPVRSAEPTLLLRVKSVEGLIADARYLAELAGKEEEAKQAEGFLKTFTGPKGLEGIDTTKPIALYGHVKEALPESPFALMLPVADEKALLDLLDRQGFKGKKGKDDIYEVAIPNSPLPAYYRLANKYIYVTTLTKENLEKSRLLSPEALVTDHDTSIFALTINLEQLPDTWKDVALGQVAMRLANYKEKNLKGETDAQHKLRVALVEDVMAQVKSVVKDGKNIVVRLDLDRKGGELSSSFSLTAKPGSAVSDLITSLGKSKTLGAGLVSSQAAATGLLHIALSDNLRKTLDPVIDEGVEKALQAAKDEGQKKLTELLGKALLPTLKAAEIDAGLSLSGPGDTGHYTAVMGFKVKEGAGIEKAIKEIVKAAPQEVQKAITVDLEKAGGVNIHKIVPDKVDAGTKAVLGDNPFYFAVRNDALLLGVGDKGLSALRAALDGDTKAASPLQVEMSMARLANLMVKDNKGAPAAAKKAFGQDKEGDKVVFVVEGGQALKVRMSIKAQVIKFIALMEEMKKKEL